MIKISLDLMLKMINDLGNPEAIQEIYSCEITQSLDPQTFGPAFRVKFNDAQKETIFKLKYSEYL